MADKLLSLPHCPDLERIHGFSISGRFWKAQKTVACKTPSDNKWHLGPYQSLCPQKSSLLWLTLFLWLSSWLTRTTENKLCILSLLSKGAPQLHILINILVHFRETLGLSLLFWQSNCIHIVVWELCSSSLGKSANDKEHHSWKLLFFSKWKFWI